MSFSSYPQGPQTPSGFSATPPSVLTAARLMYAGAALSLCGIVVAISTADELSDDLSASGDAGTELSSGLVIGSGIAFSLIGAALWLWMAWAAKAGHNWARVTSAVLFAVATVTTLVSLADPTGALSVILAVVSWLVGLADGNS
ncbi:hypothetical protein [Streptomyces parvus]|uniref:hypothetical protein n=1 Tax=Streptomyces parvus TaxID=66428 RepID=UPI001653CC8F|nr:hypothetical protein [Streptomyces parvus]